MNSDNSKVDVYITPIELTNDTTCSSHNNDVNFVYDFIHPYYLLIINKVFYQEHLFYQKNDVFFVINAILDLLLNKSKNFE